MWRAREVIIGLDEDKFLQVGTQLPPAKKKELLIFLRSNIDVFAWSAYEAPGVNLEFISHYLNVNSTIIPKRQQPWQFSKEHAKVVKEEVNKLKQAGAIQKAFYPVWLANTVVVKKKSGKWRVCVDFTDLNKACHKDPFLVPRIDQLVNTTFGYPRLSFFGCLLGLSLDTTGIAQLRKDCILDPYRELPLSSDAFQPEECWIYLPKNGDENVWSPTGLKHRSLHRWHGCKEQAVIWAPKWSGTSIFNT